MKSKTSALGGESTRISTTGKMTGRGEDERKYRREREKEKCLSLDFENSVFIVYLSICMHNHIVHHILK